MPSFLYVRLRTSLSGAAGPPITLRCRPADACQQCDIYDGLRSAAGPSRLGRVDAAPPEPSGFLLQYTRAVPGSDGGRGRHAPPPPGGAGRGRFARGAQGPRVPPAAPPCCFLFSSTLGRPRRPNGNATHWSNALNVQRAERRSGHGPNYVRRPPPPGRRSRM